MFHIFARYATIVAPSYIIKLKLEDQIFTFLTLKLPAGGHNVNNA